ncbi:acyl-CoA-binding domain-containing protein 5-like [Diadema antillarum]|uniref:acyl-CoA-binding domain-containing protein 5-like n=1 Tax=Diadema antillarum TaxID=105358 RepID=UPI003A89D7DB
MDETTEKFEKAVSVIRNLPKNGPFQPSYEMMKRFYGLYKQATEGPCTQAKPAFWNVVATQKWQAWTALEDMDSDVAKTLYVDELLKIILENANARDIPHLRQIVETMPQTDEVVGFLKAMGPFFEFVSVEDAAKEEDMATSTPKSAKVTNYANGKVKMRENGISDHGDHYDGVMNGEQNGHLELPNGLHDNTQHVDGETGNEEGKEEEEKEEVRNGEMDRTDDQAKESGVGSEGRDDSLVMVETARNEEDAVELSHPILISKSQLEAGREHLAAGSESESDGDEFCDSVDEPLIDKIKVDHISGTSHMHPISEEERESTHQTLSTPFNGDNALVTEAVVHNNVDAVIEPHTSSPSHTFRPSLLGGGDMSEGSKGQGARGSRQSQGQAGHNSSRGSLSASHSRAAAHPSHSDAGVDRALGGQEGGRLPGGGHGSNPGAPIPDPVVEQITVSLERLQRDMNSVLVRLNTLETIAISRHQMETQQAYMTEGSPLSVGSLHPRTTPKPRAPWWWPFPTLPVRTVVILLVWPVIVHWVLRFLARHRRGRRRP